MKLMSAKSRITFGLVCLLVSILSTAMMIGLVPERKSAVLAGRANVCETIAVASSDYISRGKLRRLEFLLQAVVERNDDIMSAGVRRTGGDLVVAIGDHAAAWHAESEERSDASNVHVPIRAGEEKWGSVELRFRPLGKTGVMGWMESPWLRLMGFVAGVSYFLFLFYLTKMLAHLDPSKTVPNRVRTALDSLAEGLLVIDRNQRIVLANQSFSNWVGVAPEKLIGFHAAKLKWTRNEKGDQLEEYPWVEAIRLEAPQAGVMLGLAHKKKATQVLMANASPVLGHDGKYRGVLVSFDDVTQLEKTKRNLRAAKQLADDANQAKSEFLARMSHEIRTPMNAILGYTDVLRRGFEESVENRQEYLDTIHGSGEHLLALINDILDLSKVESGRMEMELERCSPHQLIAQVARLMKSKADEKGISLDVRFDTLLPETILTDSLRVRQAITNLAGNAIKFTETGSVTIAARLMSPDGKRSDKSQAGRGKTKLAIDIIDTGIGIPKAAQAKIFEPFSQADTSVTRKFGGTGLGLAISKQLAEALGGGIEISSQEGKGSRFTVVLDIGPLEGIDLVDGKTALAATTEEAANRNQVLQLPPSRILVADDGESNRKLVELVLGRAGVEVVSVENGQLAVDRARESHFDAILMDMQMPVMDGYTATATLRDRGYELPIIALTAHAMRGDEEKCREAGCSGFVTKPIEIDVLLSTLSEALGAGSEVQCDEQDDEQAVASEVAPIVDEAIEEDGGDCDVAPASPTESVEEAVDASEDEGQQVEQTLVELADLSDEIASDDMPSDDVPSEDVPSEDVPSEDDLSDDDSSNEAASDEPCGDEYSRDEDSDTPETPTAAVEPLVCSYPMDDPDFVEIAAEFASRLDEKLASMREAGSSDDDAEVASLAHWLKGSGGTAGFDAFTKPALELELAAKSQDRQRYESLIDDLANMADRIELSASDQPAATDDAPERDTEEDPSPLLSSLPTDDEDFREIVEEFVARLAEKLAAMQRAWQARDYGELDALAHWLKGSGGTAGFDAFTAPARLLEQLSKQRDEERTPAAIDEVCRIAERIAFATAK